MFETIRTWHCEDCDTQLQAEDSECPQCQLRAEVKRLQRENERLTNLMDRQQKSWTLEQEGDHARIAELEQENEELRAEILRVAELRASAINELAKMSNHAAQLEAEKAELESRARSAMRHAEDSHAVGEIGIDYVTEQRDILSGGRGPYRPEETDTE